MGYKLKSKDEWANALNMILTVHSHSIFLPVLQTNKLCRKKSRKTYNTFSFIGIIHLQLVETRMQSNDLLISSQSQVIWKKVALKQQQHHSTHDAQWFLIHHITFAQHSIQLEYVTVVSAYFGILLSPLVVSDSDLFKHGRHNYFEQKRRIDKKWWDRVK